MCLQVCIPIAAARPPRRRKRVRGRRPFGGALFFLSVAARTTKQRIAVPKNSQKKDEIPVM